MPTVIHHSVYRSVPSRYIFGWKPDAMFDVIARTRHTSRTRGVFWLSIILVAAAVVMLVFLVSRFGNYVEY